jgi:CAAX prenyl protease-like protein
MGVPEEPSSNEASQGPSSRRPRSGLLARVADDWAYMLPMLTFLLINLLVSQSSPYYPIAYACKTVLVAGLLVWLWPKFTRVSFRYWWLGVAAGVLGIVQWVGMQLWLEKNVPMFAPPPADQLFNPFERIAPTWLAWAFVAVRIAGAALVVPVMEELFWRDYLWRRIVAPNDFKLADVGEWDWTAFLVVSGAFALVHGNWWLTSIGWGLMVGGLLVWTRSLGACMVMHATTNALLAVYVLYTRQWAFW